MPVFLKRKKYLPDSHRNIIEFEGVDVVRPPFLKFPSSFGYNYTNRNLSRVIKKSGRRHKVKIIHAHFGQNGGASIPLKRELKVPLITSFYGHDIGKSVSLFSRVYAKLISLGDCFLALSKDMKQDLIKQGFPSDKILVHHLGVNLNEFKTKKSTGKEFKVLIVANLLERKGIHHAIRAFRYLHNKYKDSFMTVVGAPKPYQNEIFTLISRLGLKDVVTYINNHDTENPRQTIKDYMSSCDIFVLPSITLSDGSKEGTPVVLMEAQASCKPCISTYHAGIPEVVIDGQTGFLVNERDVEAIADRMEILYNDKNLRCQMGHNGRKHIDEQFNITTQNQKLREIYKDLIG